MPSGCIYLQIFVYFYFSVNNVESERLITLIEFVFDEKKLIHFLRYLQSNGREPLTRCFLVGGMEVLMLIHFVSK